MFKYLRMWQWNRRWPWNDSMKVIFFSCWSFSVPGVMVLTCSDNCMSHDQWYNMFSDGCTICNGQTRNLLRIAIFNISYIRGLFPEKYFNDKSVPALGELLVIRCFSNFPQNPLSRLVNSEIVAWLTEMKIKKLMPMDAESRRLIDWMEKGTLILLIWMNFSILKF